MKKIIKVLVVLVLFAGVFTFTGCNKVKENVSKNTKSSVFQVDSKDDKHINVTLQKAKKGSQGNTTIVVGEGEQLKIRANLTGKEKVKVRVMNSDRKKSRRPVINENVFGINPYEFSIEPGEYDIYFIVLGAVSGSIDVSVE